MCSPGITKPPDSILIAVEDPDLTIDGASGTSVAIAVECHSLHQVLMAMLHDKLKLGPLLHYWRLAQ